MTHISPIAPTRRNFLKIGLAAGGGLIVGLRLPGTRMAEAANAGAPFAPNAFIRISPDERIVFIMSHTEVGQGVTTSASMLIAEELEVGLDQITTDFAPPNNALYTDPNLGEQATGGSTSTLAGWEPLRIAGATTRVMLIEAAAQRWRVDPATCVAQRGVVRESARGRSASYGQLAEAASSLPVPKDVKLKAYSQFTLIGTPQKRLDTPGKVNGSLQFGMDVKVPGMKIATVAASPVRGGKLRAINEAAARAVPGVRDVVKLDDAVAVVGDHYWAAISGLRAAAATWDDGPNGNLTSKGIVASLKEASEADGYTAKTRGDAHAAIANAAKRREAVYQLPFLAHAPMEPINTTVYVRPDGADVWVGTQVPPRAQNAIATATGLKPEQVTVHNQYMGGAFGRRLDVDSVEQAGRIAKNLGYPVKIIWSREEDIAQDFVRPYYYDRVSAGLDADNKVVGWTHRTTCSSVMARWAPGGMVQGGKLDPDTVEGAAETPYDFPAQINQVVLHETPGVITAWWRGVGPTHNLFVVEGFIDELAAEAGMDPVEFRRRMLGHNPRALAVLNLAAEKSGWGSPLPKGTGRGVMVQFAFNSYLSTVLKVSVSDRGEIALHEAHVALDVGPVVNPDTLAAQAQGGLIFGLSMAMFNEIDHDKGRVVQSNFHDYRVLRMNEAPDVQVHIVSNPTAPIGGVGEAGTASAAPALANAIFAATGKRLRRIPFASQMAQVGRS
ncbi:MAG TPA: molybdopterin cofactor-binding domain-containing protein [Acetobacteraceae bacterium]|nr:molybdopterin cofactor-binding domain-containing protein [Acetobacteraceae bacterium]